MLRFGRQNIRSLAHCSRLLSTQQRYKHALPTINKKFTVQQEPFNQAELELNTPELKLSLEEQKITGEIELPLLKVGDYVEVFR
jgi:predicted component of type VI protein secretion system